MPESSDRAEVFEGLAHIISNILKIPLDRITEESRITDLALVESIKLLRIAGKMERQFGIELEDDVLFQKAPLGDIANEVVALRRAARDEQRSAA
ncbi:MULTISPECIES: acyl carrier protein [unclassified Streptomyces]|uniref:acyl carrier protein n=1 Tax=unclassified Streptomyces TaxID=2593676 RepID=UPI0038265F3B